MMTPEQRDRIAEAARELGAAMSAVGIDFEIYEGKIERTAFGDSQRKYVYSVTVEAITTELIG